MTITSVFSLRSLSPLSYIIVIIIIIITLIFDAEVTVRINQIPVFYQNISCIFGSDYLVSSQVIQILRNKTFTRKCLLKIRIQYNIILSENNLREHILVAEEVFPFVLIILVVSLFNLLHYNIGIYTLQTFLFNFLLVITGRICLTIRSFLYWWSFPYY